MDYKRFRKPPPHLEGNLLLQESQKFGKKSWKEKHILVLKDVMHISKAQQKRDTTSILESLGKSNKDSRSISLEQVEVAESIATHVPEGYSINWSFQLEFGKEKIVLLPSSFEEQKRWVEGLEHVKTFWLRKKEAELLEKKEKTKQFPIDETRPFSDSYRLDITAFNGDIHCIHLSKDAKFKQLYRAVNRDSPCPDCAMCVLREQAAQVWILNKKGVESMVRRLETIHPHYEQGCEFFLLEHGYKLMVVQFGDGKFMAHPVDPEITAKEVLNIEKFATKLTRFGFGNIGLFLKKENGEELRFTDEEKPMQYFYRKQDGILKRIPDADGCLLLRSKTLKQSEVTDLDDTELHSGQFRARKIVTDDAQKQAANALNRLRKKQLDRPANQMQFADDYYSEANQNKSLETPKLEPHAAQNNPENHNPDANAGAESNVPDDLNPVFLSSSLSDRLSRNKSYKIGVPDSGKQTRITVSVGSRQSTGEKNSIKIRQGSQIRKIFANIIPNTDADKDTFVGKSDLKQTEGSSGPEGQPNHSSVSSQSKDDKIVDGSQKLDIPEGSEVPNIQEGLPEPNVPEGSKDSETTEGSEVPNIQDGLQELNVPEGSKDSETTEGSNLPNTQKVPQELNVPEGSEDSETTEGSEVPNIQKVSQELNVSEGSKDFQDPGRSEEGYDLKLEEGSRDLSKTEASEIPELAEESRADDVLPTREIGKDFAISEGLEGPEIQEATEKASLDTAVEDKTGFLTMEAVSKEEPYIDVVLKADPEVDRTTSCAYEDNGSRDKDNGNEQWLTEQCHGIIEHESHDDKDIESVSISENEQGNPFTSLGDSCIKATATEHKFGEGISEDVNSKKATTCSVDCRDVGEEAVKAKLDDIGGDKVEFGGEMSSSVYPKKVVGNVRDYDDEIMRYIANDVNKVDNMDIKDIAPKDIAAKDIAAKDIATEEIAAIGNATKEIATKNIATKDIATKDLSTKENTVTDTTAAIKPTVSDDITAKGIETDDCTIANDTSSDDYDDDSDEPSSIESYMESKFGTPGQTDPRESSGSFPDHGDTKALITNVNSENAVANGKPGEREASEKEADQTGLTAPMAADASVDELNGEEAEVSHHKRGKAFREGNIYKEVKLQNLRERIELKKSVEKEECKRNEMTSQNEAANGGDIMPAEDGKEKRQEEMLTMASENQRVIDSGIFKIHNSNTNNNSNGTVLQRMFNPDATITQGRSKERPASFENDSRPSSHSTSSDAGTLLPRIASTSVAISERDARDEKPRSASVPPRASHSQCPACDECFNKPFQVSTYKLIELVFSQCSKQSAVNTRPSEYDYICLSGVHLRNTGGIWDLADNTSFHSDSELTESLEITRQSSAPSKPRDVIASKVVKDRQVVLGNGICCHWIPKKNGLRGKWRVVKSEKPKQRKESEEEQLESRPITTFRPISPNSRENIANADTLKSGESSFRETAKKKIQPRYQQMFNSVVASFTSSSSAPSSRPSSRSATPSLRSASPDPVSVYVSLELVAVREQILVPLNRAVNQIRQHFNTPFSQDQASQQHEASQLHAPSQMSAAAHQHQLGDDAVTPKIGWLIRRELCSALAGLLLLGMKNDAVMPQIFPFGKPTRYNLWSLVKDVSWACADTDPVIKTMCEIIEKSPFLFDDDLRFRCFVCETLNCPNEGGREKLFVTWYKRLLGSPHVAKKFYKQGCVWRLQDHKQADLFFEETMLMLGFLNEYTFNLQADFEYRELRKKQNGGASGGAFDRDQSDRLDFMLERKPKDVDMAVFTFE
eukprot:gene19518-21448_t